MLVEERGNSFIALPFEIYNDTERPYPLPEAHDGSRGVVEGRWLLLSSWLSQVSSASRVTLMSSVRQRTAIKIPVVSRS